MFTSWHVVLLVLAQGGAATVNTCRRGWTPWALWLHPVSSSHLNWGCLLLWRYWRPAFPVLFSFVFFFLKCHDSLELFYGEEHNKNTWLSKDKLFTTWNLKFAGSVWKGCVNYSNSRTYSSNTDAEHKLLCVFLIYGLSFFVDQTLLMLSHWSWLVEQLQIWPLQPQSRSFRLAQLAVWPTWSLFPWTQRKSDCRWGSSTVWEDTLIVGRILEILRLIKCCQSTMPD